MADFIQGISRLFAIPSDVSSSYSLDELNSPRDGSNTNAGGAAGKNGKGSHGGSGHKRTLTPLSMSDGNGTTTSASFGEGTLSYGSDSVGTGTNSRASDHDSADSTSTETMEEHLHLGPMDLQYRHGEVIEKSENSHGSRGDLERRREQRANPTAASTNDRGRQRRNDDSAYRSASEPRRSDKKAHSVASSRRAGSNAGNGVNINGGGVSSRNIMLQLNSPKKKGNRRHRSLSKMGARSAAASSSNNKDPTLAPVNSWSSGEEKGGRERPRRSSSRASSARKKAERGTPPTPSTQKTHEDNNLSGSNHTRQSAKDRNAAAKDTKDRSAAAAKKVKKKDSGGWRSKLAGGMKKHLSPGSGTPDQKKISSKSNSKSKKKHQNNFVAATTPSPTNKKSSHKLTSSPGLGYSPQPINVGDSVVISQQFLEEGMEMSVLTLPRELAAMNEDQAVAAEFDKTIQDVGHRYAMENDHVQRFLARHRANNNRQVDVGMDVVPSASTGISTSPSRGPMYQNISEYASRVLEEGHIYQSYSQDREDQDQQSFVHDNGEHGIEVLSPSSSGKHSWPCDPSADGYSPASPDSIPPPPPPPPLSLLSPKHARSPRNYNAAAAAAAAAPHFNTPINSNSASVATSYEDPPGTLVSSPTLVTAPTLQTLQYSLSDPPESDPPGDHASSYRPFDEDSGFCGNNNTNNKIDQTAPPTPGEAMAPNIQNKRSSAKAVTFSLPPPSASHPPAPPFMGPPLDYYYSMERNPDKDPLPWMSSSPLLPPIIELWASVESADNVPADVGGDVTVWNAKRENSLVGEDVPLDVSEEWIDVPNKEEQVEPPSHDDAENQDVASEGKNLDNDSQQQTGFKNMCSTNSSSTWEANKHYSLDDTPHDEYFDDVIKKSHEHDEYFDNILNCGEDLTTMDVKACDDDNQAQQQSSQDGANLATIPSNISDDSGDCGIEVEDTNFRHRSTWKTAYKPPRVASSEDDSYLPDTNSSGSDKWQKLVRHRSLSAAVIQKSVRGMLERQRLRLLMDAVLVIQPFVRNFLERKRYLEYLKVKRSYYPRRWERSNMAVAI